jgi:predicted ATPase
MGIHTGTPHLTEEGYVGEDVHLGARIAASGHGGQILLSEETCAGLDTSQTVLLDLGEHRLRDFAEPVWIYQLGSERFPPLKTISNTNLPRPASSFVGREREVAELVALLSDGARLVTLTGPGGSGKTRLALKAASELVPEFKNGTFWVGLAPLRDPRLVSETIAQTLGAKDGLAEHIGERELLLLLDNFEQVVEAASELAALVEACANLRLLVTSRELLRVRGEVEYTVPPLAEPEAVQLFCARAQQEPSEEISDLCRRLDNLPLAVELAAARTSALSPAQILERLARRLDLLKGGRDADARQETLRATMQWSYELLDEIEQRLFVRLAVFAGGWTLAAAEEVSDAELDVLQSLVDKSLVRHAGERFWLLETIREYAAERLDESGEAEQLRRRHAEHFLALAQEAEPSIVGVRPGEWLDLLEHEHDNMRAALSCLRGSPLQLRLAAALWRFWLDRGYLSEGRAWLKAALTQPEDASAEDLSRALRGASALARLQGDFQEARLYAEESLAAARNERDPALESRALGTLANVELARGDYRRAAELHAQAEAIFRDLGDHRMLAIATCNRSYLALEMGDYEQALELARDAVGLSREVGDPGNALSSLLNLTLAAKALGQEATARSTIPTAVEQARELGQTESLVIAVITAAALLSRTEPRTAAVLLAAASQARDDLRLELGPVEQDLFAATEAATRTTLGDNDFSQCTGAGVDLSLEHAGELAAEHLPPR